MAICGHTHTHTHKHIYVYVPLEYKLQSNEEMSYVQKWVKSSIQCIFSKREKTTRILYWLKITIARNTLQTDQQTIWIQETGSTGVIEQKKKVKTQNQRTAVIYSEQKNDLDPPEASPG